jgi:DNA-binding NarL/FixJ family response regulator
MIRRRIIVADDSPQFLDKLRSSLALEFDIVATAMDGKTALELILRHQLDLAVLDLNMPGLNGIEVASELAKSLLNLPVLICSMETDSDIVGLPGKQEQNMSSKRGFKRIYLPLRN